MASERIEDVRISYLFILYDFKLKSSVISIQINKYRKIWQCGYNIMVASNGDMWNKKSGISGHNGFNDECSAASVENNSLNLSRDT